jgi:hypothetical protein
MTECSSGKNAYCRHRVVHEKAARTAEKSAVRVGDDSERRYCVYFEPVRRSAGFG